MYLRIFSALAFAATQAACGGSAESPEPEGEQVTCAIGDGVQMSDVCLIEEVTGNGVSEFLLHHPDGGFRRISFDIQTQELGVVDGAESLRINDQSTDDFIEFTIGTDRYRLATGLIRQPSLAE